METPRLNSHKLREISEKIFSGITPKSGGEAYTNIHNGITFVRSGEITEDCLVLTETEVYIKPEIHYGLMRRSQLKRNDLLIAIVGATIGKVGVYNRDAQANINQAIAAVRMNISVVLPEFVVFFLKTSTGQLLLDFLKRPVARANINLEEVGDIILPIPPLPVQEKLISQMEVARESRKQKFEQATALLEGMDGFILDRLNIKIPTSEDKAVFAIRLRECFNNRVDPYYHSPKYHKLTEALNNSQHPKLPLSAISTDITGGATPTRGDTELYATEGIKFLRILNVQPNEIDLSEVKYIQPSVHDGALSRSKLAVNDVLMTITGRVGTAAVVIPSILPANINQHIVRLRIVCDDCLPEYLAAWLNTSMGIELSNRSVTGGTRVALDYEAIRNLLIPVPPPAIQQTIIQELSNCKSQAQRLRREAEAEWETAKAHFETQLLGENMNSVEESTNEG